jgi:hypothetical protein
LEVERCGSIPLYPHVVFVVFQFPMFHSFMPLLCEQVSRLRWCLGCRCSQ